MMCNDRDRFGRLRDDDTTQQTRPVGFLGRVLEPPVAAEHHSQRSPSWRKPVGCGRWFDFRCRVTNLSHVDSLDSLPLQFRRSRDELPLNFLHLSRTPGQIRDCGNHRDMNRDDQRAFPRYDGHCLRRVAYALFLKCADRIGDLLRRGGVESVHRMGLWRPRALLAP